MKMNYDAITRHWKNQYDMEVVLEGKETFDDLLKIEKEITDNLEWKEKRKQRLIEKGLI